MNSKSHQSHISNHGVVVQVGSDAYNKKGNFLTHLLLHNMGVKIFHVFVFFKIAYLSFRLLHVIVFLVVRRSRMLFGSPV